MSALLLSRIDTALLYPPFLEKLRALLDEALAGQRAYWVVEGHRSYKRSDDLFAQGRTKPGPIVTRARAGQSAHNFGIAADLVLDGYMDRAGLQPDYRPASYDILASLSSRHGLVWGGAWTFKDPPHIQWPGFVTAEEMQPLRKALEVGGLDACWAYLNGVCRIPVPASGAAP